MVATVCDLSTVNLKVLKTLGATASEPYFKQNEHEIVAILDPPHLLKCTRNLFMKHDVECTTIQCNDTTIKGILIEQLFYISSVKICHNNIKETDWPVSPLHK